VNIVEFDVEFDEVRPPQGFWHRAGHREFNPSTA